MTINTTNLILRSDSYKFSQHLQMPPGTEYVYSYIESRGGKWDETLFFGLQFLLKDILSKPVTKADVDEAEEIVLAHGLPFNREGWDYIVNVHGGRLPILISAVPEGTVVPVHNVLLSIVNTDPKCFWLTSFVETILLRAVWYPTTVATKSMVCKRVIMDYLRKTSDDPEGQIGFKLHDFGARGVSSGESAAIGGTAHLVNFMGTDTVEALVAARRFYGADMAGYSIPASEHSTMTAWGKDAEVDAYRNMVRQFAKPGALFACVSDSYDLFNAIDNLWGGELRQEVIDSGAMLVVRPDCYDSETEVLTETGWKMFRDVDYETSVAQVHDNWTVSFTNPTRIVNEKYSGPMIKFSDEKGRLDLVVTPNHRMVYADRLSRLKVQEAHDATFFFQKDIPRIAIAPSDTEEMTAYERFLIAFQADGSFPSGWVDGTERDYGSICGHISVRFNFQKQRKTERLIEICKVAGLSYDIYREPKRGETLDQTTLYVRVPVRMPLNKTFSWVNPMKRGFSWCESFIEEVGHWDATRRNKGRMKYDTTIRENAETVQLVAIRAGFGCTYSIHEDNRSTVFSDLHSLTVTNKTVVGGQSVKKEAIEYEGTVHCVTVPTGRLVVRRNRKVVVCGNSGDPTTVPVEAVRRLAERFGTTVNAKGYKVINHVRVIQGDGINEDTIPVILENLTAAGFSTDCISFGMGGGLLQQVNRDTQRFAMKASAAYVNGEWIEIFKDPITDPGKVSKKGRLALVYEEGVWETLPEDGNAYRNQLVRVFFNGRIEREWTFGEVRSRAFAGF